MIWATRQFAIDGWFDVQETFDAVWQSLGSPAQMMMVGINEERVKKRIFISLPDTNLISHFPGFESIKPEELPEGAGLLVGNVGGFREQFKFEI